MIACTQHCQRICRTKIWSAIWWFCRALNVHAFLFMSCYFNAVSWLKQHFPGLKVMCSVCFSSTAPLHVWTWESLQLPSSLHGTQLLPHVTGCEPAGLQLGPHMISGESDLSFNSLRWCWIRFSIVGTQRRIFLTIAFEIMLFLCPQWQIFVDAFHICPI